MHLPGAVHATELRNAPGSPVALAGRAPSTPAPHVPSFSVASNGRETNSLGFHHPRSCSRLPRDRTASLR